MTDRRHNGKPTKPEPEHSTDTEQTPADEAATPKASRGRSGTDGAPSAGSGREPAGRHNPDVAVNPPSVRRQTAITDDTPAGTQWGERFDGSGESTTHLWGKLALHRRHHARQQPWFRGTYEYERTVADLIADCLVSDPDPKAWIEFVASPGHQYTRKSEMALRFGYPIYWVFHTDADTARRTAVDAFDSRVETPVSFGTFDPEYDRLTLGEPLTFEAYRVPITDLKMLSVPYVRGRCAGAASIPRTGHGYDLGWIRVGQHARRVYTTVDGQKVRLVAPGQPVEDVEPIDLADRTTQFARQVAAGEVERIGPIPPTSTYTRRSEANVPPQRGRDG